MLLGATVRLEGLPRVSRQFKVLAGVTGLTVVFRDGLGLEGAAFAVENGLGHVRLEVCLIDVHVKEVGLQP